MTRNRLGTALCLAFVAVIAQAGEAEDAIRKTLNSMQMDVPADAIQAAPMAGLYQVNLPGGRVLYASADGKYLIQGYLFAVENGKGKNLTQIEEAKGVAKTLNAVDRSDMVIFAPKEPKTHITVFTDTDCGYCQKLHTEVPELNKLGVEVRYMAFPRQGLSGPTYETMVSVWCAKDRNAAMDLAKARKSVPEANCANPIARQFELGQQIGVNGTPAIVLANGQVIPGYQPAAQLAKTALEAR